MENFLKTKRGLEYLLETSPSDMRAEDAVAKAKQDYQDAENDELMRQAEDMYGAGWL
jgi:hypothetical protein